MNLIFQKIAWIEISICQESVNIGRQRVSQYLKCEIIECFHLIFPPYTELSVETQKVWKN